MSDRRVGRVISGDEKGKIRKKKKKKTRPTAARKIFRAKGLSVSRILPGAGLEYVLAHSRVVRVNILTLTTRL